MWPDSTGAYSYYSPLSHVYSRLKFWLVFINNCFFVFCFLLATVVWSVMEHMYTIGRTVRFLSCLRRSEKPVQSKASNWNMSLLSVWLRRLRGTALSWCKISWIVVWTYLMPLGFSFLLIWEKVYIDTWDKF